MSFDQYSGSLRRTGARRSITQSRGVPLQSFVPVTGLCGSRGLIALMIGQQVKTRA